MDENMKEMDMLDAEATEVNVTVTSKPKMSLKKKLLIGGGALLGLVLGAIALMPKQTTTAEDLFDDSDEDIEEETEEKNEDSGEDDVTITNF